MRFLSYLGVSLVGVWIGIAIALANQPTAPEPKEIVVVQKSKFSCKEAVRQCRQSWSLR